MATPAFRFVKADACNMCGAPADRFHLMGRRNSGHQGLRARRATGVSVTVFRCGACGLVFPDPMPRPVSVESLYGVAPASYWRPDYFDVPPGYFADTCAIVRELLPGVSAPRALDVGAGVGKAVLAMGKLGFDAKGLEPSPTFRDFALERMGLAADDIILGSVEDVTFPDEAFDFINLAAVVEHLQDPRGSLEKAWRWLAPGGVVYVEVPSARWLLSRGLNLFYSLTAQGFVTNTSPMHPPFHLYEFTERSVRMAATAIGYEVVRSEVWVGDVYAPSLVRPLLRSVMARTGTGMQLAVWLRKP